MLLLCFGLFPSWMLLQSIDVVVIVMLSLVSLLLICLISVIIRVETDVVTATLVCLNRSRYLAPLDLNVAKMQNVPKMPRRSYSRLVANCNRFGFVYRSYGEQR